MPDYRSKTSTHGRNMAGARALWRATGMKDGDFGKPIIAVVNSFTQFVPGHVHLRDLGALVAKEIEAAGGVAKEFNTIAVDDGIAMGHGGMLYSLPSRRTDRRLGRIHGSTRTAPTPWSEEHLQLRQDHPKACWMAAMRLNIPVVFVSGGPMEAGKVKSPTDGQVIAKIDLIDAMIKAGDSRVSDAEVAEIERSACPTCGSCSGMFTANSMNCLTEAIGLALPGNGTIVATHAWRQGFLRSSRPAASWRGPCAAATIRKTTRRFCRAASPASRLSRMPWRSDALAMGGSTNTVLHLLAAAQEGGVDFTMSDIDRISRKVPCSCARWRPPPTNTISKTRASRWRHLRHSWRTRPRAELLDLSCGNVHSGTLGNAIAKWDVAGGAGEEAQKLFRAVAPGGISDHRRVLPGSHLRVAGY